MPTITITTGTELSFIHGEFTATSINEAGLVYGTLDTFDENGNIESTEQVQYTKKDIENYLYMTNGRIFKVVTKND